MTKENLKQLILEVYKEETKKKNKAKPAKEVPAKKVPAKKVPAKKVVAVSKKVEEPANKVTKRLVHDIETQEKSNVFKGDGVDAKLFGRLGVILKRHIGSTLEESDVEKMMEDMQCDECWEEGAKPDFLDLNHNGNREEPMKAAADDIRKKLKEIIEKAKNI